MAASSESGMEGSTFAGGTESGMEGSTFAGGTESGMEGSAFAGGTESGMEGSTFADGGSDSESGMEGSSFGEGGGAIRANDDDLFSGRPYFSCWSQRGNWTLHGYTWWRATFPSSTLLERVTECLRANAWCYSMDLSALPAPQQGWFLIHPDTLTHSIAEVLVSKCGGMLRSDYIGLMGGSRLPEAQQRREELVWVHVVAYFWNIAGASCAGPCVQDNQPLQFTAHGLVQNGGDPIEQSYIHSHCSVGTTNATTSGGTSAVSSTMSAMPF